MKKLSVQEISEKVNSLLQENGVTEESGYSFVFSITDKIDTEKSGVDSVINAFGESKGVALTIYSIMENLIKRDESINYWFFNFINSNGNIGKVLREDNDCQCEECVQRKADYLLKQKEAESKTTFKDFLKDILKDKN